MPRQPDAQHTDDTVAAIGRVLRAEHDCVGALRPAADRAQHLRVSARAEAAAIARRADRCIARLYTNYLPKIDREVPALNAGRLTQVETSAHDREQLSAAAVVDLAESIAVYGLIVAALILNRI